MKTITYVFVFLFAVGVAGTFASTPGIVKTHPVKIDGMPDCTACHTNQWKRFNHKAVDFFDRHGDFARSQRLACSACHQQAFCSDCHTNKEEIKPSDKLASSPQRNLPHRGDYLTQHMIDGQVNPASCAKCHGRQNNSRCRTCHR